LHHQEYINRKIWTNNYVHYLSNKKAWMTTNLFNFYL
jgi:hypothetical protein